jgi:hypothetical protein
MENGIPFIIIIKVRRYQHLKKSRARDDTLRNRFQQQESISGPAPYSFSFLHIKIHAVVQSKTIDSTIQRSETIEIVGQKSRRD